MIQNQGRQILPPGAIWQMSRDIFDCHSLGGQHCRHLAGRGQQCWMLLSINSVQNSPPQQMIMSPNVSCARLRNPAVAEEAHVE